MVYSARTIARAIMNPIMSRRVCVIPYITDKFVNMKRIRMTQVFAPTPHV